MTRSREQQEQVDTLLSDMRNVINKENVRSKLNSNRLAHDILALPNIGIIDQNQDKFQLIINGHVEEEYHKLIPKE